MFSEEIDKINQAIQAGLKNSNTKLFGIAYPVRKREQVLLIDKNSTPICPDDNYDLIVYHRIGNTPISEGSGRGGEKEYKINLGVKLFCYAKNKQAFHYLISVLAQMHNVKVTGANFDTLTNIQSQFRGLKFDFSNPFFSIDYTLEDENARCREFSL